MNETKRKVDDGGMRDEVERTVAEGGRIKTEVPSVSFEERAEGDMTLAQLSLSPAFTSGAKHGPFHSSVKEEEEPLETGRKEKRVKVRRRYTDSKVKRGRSEHNGKCICCKQTEVEKETSKAPSEVNTSAVIRAEEVQSNLEATFPSFVKSLVRSHVNGCFWMGLPGPFCRSNLPHEDSVVTLVEEGGREFNMKYIAHKTGLSAGWRQFAVAQQLLEGDVLVFQLIGNCKFKVYIIRAHDFSEVEGALGLLNLDAPAKQNDYDDADFTVAASNNKRRKRTKSLPLTVVEDEKTRLPLALVVAQTANLNEQYDSEGVGSEVLEDYKLATPCTQYGDIKDFEDFNIIVDGAIIDSQFSEEIRGKYYKLCCSQNSFIHGNLLKGLNSKLVAGIITEVVNIADAMRVCTLLTTREEFDCWDKTLKASEMFGMSVGFLRSRLDQLMTLAFDSEDARKAKRFIEARNERDKTDQEIRLAEAQLQELKKTYEKCVSRMETLKSMAETYEQKFQEEAVAPW